MLCRLVVVGIGLSIGQYVSAQTPAPLTVTFEDALKRARANSQQLLSADIAVKLAREDRMQAKAALLPSVNWLNQFIYTQPNGSDTGVFVSNDGPHIYNNQAVVHGEIYAPGKLRRVPHVAGSRGRGPRQGRDRAPRAGGSRRRRATTPWFRPSGR